MFHVPARVLFSGRLDLFFIFYFIKNKQKNKKSRHKYMTKPEFIFH